jgi:DNA-binding transcriptional regulator YdaS (Cro superfamily)
MDLSRNYDSAMTYSIEQSRKALKRAVEIVGGQPVLARKLSEILDRKVHQSNVSAWLNSSKEIPSRVCIPIERITERQVMRWDLRPDLWPEKKCRDVIAAMC